MHFLIFLTVGLVAGILALEATFRLARFVSDLQCLDAETAQ